AFSAIVRTAQRVIHTTRRSVDQLDATVKSQTQRQLAEAREYSATRMNDVRLRANATVHEARTAIQSAVHQVNDAALRQVSAARHNSAEQYAIVGAQAGRRISEVKAGAKGRFETITGLAGMA